MRKRSLTLQIGVLFDDQIHAKLIQITEAQEIPISRFIRRIITAYLNHIDKKEEHSNEPKTD